MKRLDEHTNVYLYEEQSEDHHFGLDLMMARVWRVLASRIYLSDGRFNKNGSWSRSR